MRVSTNNSVCKIGLLFPFVVLVVWFVFIMLSMFLMSFLHESVVCPDVLHVKQVILSSVKNILKLVSSWLISRDPGSFGMSLSLM